MKPPKLLGGTRFTRAATPKLGGALELQHRIIGQNPRKQKLTESPGTNPSKFVKPVATARPKSSGLMQNSAPYKHEIDYPIGVGGPGYDELEKP